jgi:hypothetical protein
VSVGADLPSLLKRRRLAGPPLTRDGIERMAKVAALIPASRGYTDVDIGLWCAPFAEHCAVLASFAGAHSEDVTTDDTDLGL